jgi:hypothetical protein
VPQYNKRECERIHPVNMQMEDVEANNHSLSNFSQTRRDICYWCYTYPEIAGQ